MQHMFTNQLRYIVKAQCASRVCDTTSHIVTAGGNLAFVITGFNKASHTLTDTPIDISMKSHWLISVKANGQSSHWQMYLSGCRSQKQRTGLSCSAWHYNTETECADWLDLDTQRAFSHTTNQATSNSIKCRCNHEVTSLTVAACTNWKFVSWPGTKPGIAVASQHHVCMCNSNFEAP